MERGFLYFSLALAVWMFLRWRRQRLPLPPGPKPLPIVGNMFNMPVDSPWKTYQKWCLEQGSDVVYLHLPLQSTIVLNSVKATREILEKRSRIYSDRARVVMVEVLGWDFNLSFMMYGPRWRAHRRTFHQFFSQHASLDYVPSQLEEVKSFLLRILENPGGIRDHVRLLSTSVIFSAVYGIKISRLDNNFVHLAEKGAEVLDQALIPGAFWVEYLPFLKYLPDWLPGNRAGKLRQEYYQTVRDMRDKPYEAVKAAVENGTAPPSMTHSLIKQLQQSASSMTADQLAEEEETGKNVAGVAYAASSETTTSAIEAALLPLALFPEVQKKAQAELDRVVGPDRMPDASDIDSLVYINAIVLESLRWIPISPFGFGHKLNTDDTYEGYLIPKGTLVIPNIWSILHNPEDYPEPERFMPERYIGEDGKINPDVLDPATIAYGFGRRVCPGRYFANNTLMVTVASVLHVFDITAGVGDDGKPHQLSSEPKTGFLSGPKDIPRGFKPRSMQAERLIRESVWEHSA